MESLNSKVWAPLFEGYDPGATKLNLELRHPLIDVRLIEYLLAIPAAPWCVNKQILRLAMQDRLPAAVLNRPKTPLGGDPALQLARSVSVRWLDTFEVNPQLERFVNLKLRRAIADEKTSDGLWANLRVFALNYWLTNSQPIVRRATEKPIEEDHPAQSAQAIPMTA
jgi:asparagine synthase (glutamine-hydrolysing)